MRKFALFVFNPDPMCFIHVMLNALDMKEKGHQVKIILEGGSVKLIPNLFEGKNPLNPLWKKVMEAGMVEGLCKACATNLGTIREAQGQGMSLLGDMSGHPGMAEYRDDDFEIITF